MIVSLSSAAYSNQRPLNRIIPSFLSNSDFAAVPPTLEPVPTGLQAGCGA